MAPGLRTDVKVYTSSTSLPAKLIFFPITAHCQPEKSNCLPGPDCDTQRKTQLDSATMPPRANQEVQDLKDYENFLANRKLADSVYCKYKIFLSLILSKS